MIQKNKPVMLKRFLLPDAMKLTRNINEMQIKWKQESCSYIAATTSEEKQAQTKIAFY